MNCIFCKMAAGEITPDVVYEDDAVLAFRDQNPQAPTHVLVIPREHIETLNDVTGAHDALMARLFAAARKVAALDGMDGVEDRGIFLQRAAQIDSRSLAYFMRRHAEMLKNHQSRGAGFVRFVSLAGYPFNVTRAGRLVGVMPLDAVAWTETIAQVLRACAADARKHSRSGRVELRITGTATPLARRELRALGWRVAENARF